jgi:hypothetical protein
LLVVLLGVAPSLSFSVHIDSPIVGMSKRAAKASASSARAASTFGSAPAFGGSFGGSASQLSYVAEPPNLSTISDPNVVVYYRNLSKKDSTTKAKALEDLQTYIAALQEPVEEGVLEAWVSFSDVGCREHCSNENVRLQCTPEHRSTMPKPSVSCPISFMV